MTGSSASDIDTLVQQFGKSFSLKNLGQMQHFLGIEVTTTSSGLHLSQGKYIKDILDRVNMVGASGCPTLMVSSLQLSKFEGQPTVDGKLFRSTVGALQSKPVYGSTTRHPLEGSETDFALTCWHY